MLPFIYGPTSPLNTAGDLAVAISYSNPTPGLWELFPLLRHILGRFYTASQQIMAFDHGVPQRIPEPRVWLSF